MRHRCVSILVRRRRRRRLVQAATCGEGEAALRLRSRLPKAKGERDEIRARFARRRAVAPAASHSPNRRNRSTVVAALRRPPLARRHQSALRFVYSPRLVSTPPRTRSAFPAHPTPPAAPLATAPHQQILVRTMVHRQPKRCAANRTYAHEYKIKSYRTDYKNIIHVDSAATSSSSSYLESKVCSRVYVASHSHFVRISTSQSKAFHSVVVTHTSPPPLLPPLSSPPRHRDKRANEGRNANQRPTNRMSKENAIASRAEPSRAECFIASSQYWAVASSATEN